MTKSEGDLPTEFYDKIRRIETEKIRINPLNPRKRFSQVEEDELLASIATKGILNPIIVYEKNGLFYLIEGQRRYEAAKKLKIDTIPAHILKKEPTTLEKLSMMFHLHNIREEWTDFAIALTIQRIKDETGTDNVYEISKLTSLSAYKVKKYMSLLDFPESVINKFLESEKKENPDLDSDMLIELHPIIDKTKDIIPDFFKKYSVEKIVDICIVKKQSEIIKTNREFRDILKMVTAVKRGNLDKTVFKEKLIEFLENKNTTLEKIYADTTQSSDKANNIIKIVSKLKDDILNIDLRKLSAVDKENLKREFSKLKKLFEEKF
jgi:ParB/RepB/Spo0J family partition protein